MRTLAWLLSFAALTLAIPTQGSGGSQTISLQFKGSETYKAVRSADLKSVVLRRVIGPMATR